MIENMQLQKLMSRKQWAYRTLFLGADGKPNEAAKIVLADLVGFVNLDEDIVGDPVLAFGAEKARSPVRRILRFLRIDYAQANSIHEAEGDEL